LPVFFKILIKRQQRTHPQSEFYEDGSLNPYLLIK
jgi:hypothetical protein